LHGDVQKPSVQRGAQPQESRGRQDDGQLGAHVVHDEQLGAQLVSHEGTQ
jgi:hypothetical protein